MCIWGIYVVSSSCLESLSSALLKTFTPLPEPDTADSNIYSRIDRGCIRKTSNLIFLSVYGRTTSKMEKSNSLSASKRIGILYTRAGIASRCHLPRLYREITRSSAQVFPSHSLLHAKTSLTTPLVYSRHRGPARFQKE